MPPSSTSMTTSPLGPSSSCQRERAGFIFRQGRHFRKPNSSQTTLPRSFSRVIAGGGLNHWSGFDTSSDGALPRYEFAPPSCSSSPASSAAPIQEFMLFQLLDRLEDGLAVLRGGDFRVLVGDLSRFVDDEGPALDAHAAGELLFLVVDL